MPVGFRLRINNGSSAVEFDSACINTRVFTDALVGASDGSAESVALQGSGGAEVAVVVLVHFCPAVDAVGFRCAEAVINARLRGKICFSL